MTLSRRWNTVCTLGAFSDPLIEEAMRTMAPRLFTGEAGYPAHLVHRKCWEEASTYLALRDFGAIRPDAEILGVAAGHELVAYHLTNEVRWVFATDLYGDGAFAGSGDTAELDMLRDPARFAHAGIESWRPGRLVVEHMDALALRAEDETFDAAFSQSSIEHMGGIAGAIQAVREMARVVRPGGVVTISTECCLNGAPYFETPDLSIFTPDQFAQLQNCSPLLEPVEHFSFQGQDVDPALVLDLPGQVARQQQGLKVNLPHVLLHLEGRVFTSGLLVWRRVG